MCETTLTEGRPRARERSAWLVFPSLEWITLRAWIALALAERARRNTFKGEQEHVEILSRAGYSISESSGVCARAVYVYKYCTRGVYKL